MPAKKKCKETLKQVRDRLTREQRLRTERRIRELLDPEQLAVTEEDLEVSDSELEVALTSHSKTTVSKSNHLDLDCLYSLDCCGSLRVLV